MAFIGWGANITSQPVVPPDPGEDYPGTLPKIMSRPTGANYVRYEDLVQGGDDVTTATVNGQVIRQYGVNVFQTIINRCPANKWITFPAGVFEVNTPNWNANGSANNGAVRWPSTSYGAIGNYPPGTGWDDLAPDSLRTVFRVKANTAPDYNCPGAWFKIGYDGSVQQSWANIHFEGTEQGMQKSGALPSTHPDYDSQHPNVTYTQINPGPGNDGTSHRVFTNAFFWNTADGSSARDILSTGNFGNNGAPPGESFSVTWYGSTNGVMCRVNVDGRRAAGGQIWNATGIGWGNALNCIATDCYVHHGGQAGIALWQTVGCKSYGCTLGDPTDTTTNHIIGNMNGCWLNHERTTGSEHTDIALNVWCVGKSQREHISHSNDTYTLSRSGQSISTANGTLKVVNDTHSRTLFSGSGYPLAIAAWSPYGNGDTQQIANSPLVVAADGVTHVPYKWRAGSAGVWTTIN